MGTLKIVQPRDWDPNEWQSYCVELLTAHYEVRVQIFPDRVHGDGGLEAYVADEGIGFQCYAPDSPFNVGAQTEAQRTKIRTDTKKLIDKPIQTQELIGPGNEIRQWVLLTPAFEDKSLVAYAGKRAVEVRNAASEDSWCSDDFRISVHDDSLFAIERARLYGVPSNQVTAISQPIDIGALRATGQVPDTLDAILDTKFQADPTIAARPQTLVRYRDSTLADYFRGQVEMTRLRRDAGAIHEAVAECAEVIFSGLILSIAGSDARPLVLVNEISENLSSLIAARVPGLGQGLCNLLARYYIASWWIECPLEFEVEDV